MKDKSREAINKASSQFLDLARWVSAIAVVLDHITYRMFDFHSGAHNPAVFILWRFLAGFGHQAVVVFFVLSGYLVGGKIIRETARQSFHPARYLIDRTTRIYLVLLPALVLIALLDNIGLTLFGPPVYDMPSLGEHLSWTAFLGSIASMQNFLVPTFGTDGPLGTLANEWWYYITFPLLIAPFNAGYGLMRKTVCALAGAALLGWLSCLQIQHGIGFIVWLIGAFAATITVPSPARRPLLALAMFVAVLLGVRIGIRAADFTLPVGLVVDWGMALVFGWLLCALRADPWKPWSGRMDAINSTLAGFSYSLYAVHVPIVMLICAVLEHSTGFGWQETPSHGIAIIFPVSTLIVALTAAYLFSLITERNTRHVREAARRAAGLQTGFEP